MKSGRQPNAGGIAAVVLAAGSGGRFGSYKQYALLGGERLIDRAVRLACHFTNRVVVVLPEGHVWDGPPIHASVAGGRNRGESVRNAVQALPTEAEIVLIHDVIRPLATRRIVRDLLEAVNEGADAAIPIWETPDPVKRVDEDGRVSHAGRDEFVMAQSPAAFSIAILNRMLDELPNAPFEDTVGVEQVGGKVVGVRGDRWSQHVVEPRDLRLIERLIDVIEEGDSEDGNHTGKPGALPKED